MSRSNYDKPFYVDVGTSVVAIRCASNHDVLVQYDYGWHPSTLELAKKVCDRMNKEAEIGKPLRNCDVGTEQEQQDRFREFCRHYESMGECGIGRSKAACPAFQGGRNPDCSLWWSQMPYEKGE